MGARVTTGNVVASQKGINRIIEIGKSVISKIIFCLRLWFRPLTFWEKEFIETNGGFWKCYKQKQNVHRTKYVFVRPEKYPLILLGNAMVGSFVAFNRNSKLLFLLPSYFDKAREKILKSFPNSCFIYEDCWRYLFYKCYSNFQAKKIIRLFKKPEDIFAFEIDGIQFGDLIYDSFLSCGFATMNMAESDMLLKVLQKFFYQRSIIRDVLKRYNIEIGFTSHIVGIGGGVFLRYLLHNNIEVIVRETTLKKYNKVEMSYECCMTPDKRYISFMKSCSDYFIPLAERCLKERLENRNRAVKDQLAYRSEKRLFRDKQEFSCCFNLNPNKKNVFVMLHAFNDYPHTYGFLIFRDYYEWLEAVLKIAQQTESVNWIFKEHPYAKYYPTRDLNLEKMFANIEAPQIRFLAEDADFNTSSLQYIADAVVTCIGTAGLEYSAFGIPCVLAGKCWYSGFGFTIEPQTKLEYEKILHNINRLPRLNDQQIEMAKLIAFFTFDVVELTKFPDPFKNLCTYDISEQKTFSTEEVFERVVTHRRKTSSKDKMKYIRSLDEFLSNPNYTQFVDFDRYGLFREVIGDIRNKLNFGGFVPDHDATITGCD